MADLKMPKKRKRENAHYEQQLQAEYPGVYDDFLADRIRSLQHAARIAGLMPERTRFEKLKNSWKKATTEERDAFLQWLGESGSLPEVSPRTEPPAPSAPIATGRYLLPSAASRIKSIMAKRRLNAADVMTEMGFGPDKSLSRALVRNTSLRLTVIAGLETWLNENANA